MLNFSCVAETEDLSGASQEEIDSCAWFNLEEAARQLPEKVWRKNF